MYPLVSASRTLLRTCIRRHVDGYKLLVRDTCIRLHVSGVNAAEGVHLRLSVSDSCLFVCLFVCLHDNSKMNDPKVFKLGIGN